MTLILSQSQPLTLTLLHRFSDCRAWISFGNSAPYFNHVLRTVPIKFTEAIFVAVIELFANAISAKPLHHDHGDLSIRAAYIHVLADGLTSLTAIIALSIGLYYNFYWLDSARGLIGSIVISAWAAQLIKGSGIELIDFKENKTS